MATNEKIKLDITSAFDPGGFTRADKAVKGLGQTMNRQGEAVNKVMTAFGDANTAGGQLAKTAQNLMGALAGGGIWGLAAAGVALVVTKFMEAREAAKKFFEEQQKAWREDLIKKTENGLSSLMIKHGRIADEIERGAKAADKIAKAYESLAKSETAVMNAAAEKRVAELEGEKQSALSGEKDPLKRMAIELDFTRKIVEAKKDSAEQERKNNEKAAASKVEEAKKNLDLEKTRLTNLKAKENELQDLVDKSAIDEYSKKNPMPGRESFTKTINTGSGAMGIGGGRTVLDESAYKDAMDKWWKGANEIAKQTEDARKKQQDELKQTRDDIGKTPSSIQAAEIAIDEAQNQQKAILDLNAAARQKTVNIDKAMLEKQLEIQKLQEERQNNVNELASVERKIAQTEGKIADMKQADSLREERRKEWAGKSDQAKALGAGGWRRMNEANDAASEQRGKDTMSEARWVEGAKKRMSTGAKLSGKDLKRVFGFDEWKDLQGANPFDPAKAAEKQIKSAEDNLKELQKLNINLENALRVN
jgi:hypothetical protein